MALPQSQGAGFPRSLVCEEGRALRHKLTLAEPAPEASWEGMGLGLTGEFGPGSVTSQAISSC